MPKLITHILFLCALCTCQTDFDVTMGQIDFYITMVQLQNQCYFQGVYCNTAYHNFSFNIAIPQTSVFTQFVVLHYIQ